MNAPLPFLLHERFIRFRKGIYNVSVTTIFKGRPDIESTPHLERYLDEFVFRWNRRRHTRTAFDTLLGLVIRLPHASLRDFVDQRA